jgi:hypothetical protein
MKLLLYSKKARRICEASSRIRQKLSPIVIIGSRSATTDYTFSNDRDSVLWQYLPIRRSPVVGHFRGLLPDRLYDGGSDSDSLESIYKKLGTPKVSTFLNKLIDHRLASILACIPCYCISTILSSFCTRPMLKLFICGQPSLPLKKN